MSSKHRSSRVGLSSRLAALQNRLSEAEDTLEAIRSGAVDALVVHTPRGEQIFTLKGADQTYRALVEAMNEGAATLRNGVVFYCNTRLAGMIGKPLENVIGTSVFDFVESPGFRALIRSLQSGRRISGSLEGVLRSQSGERVAVRLSAARFISDRSHLISLVVTDITQLKAVEAALRESEQRFQIVAQTASDAIWDWDLKTDRVWRSDSFARLFGFRAKSVGTTFRWGQNRIHAEDRAVVMRTYSDALRGKTNIFSVTYRFRRGDGMYVYIADRARILRDARGKPIRVIGARRDISEQMEAEHARQALSRNILNAQEQERQRVARDLHDSVTQLLASARYRLSSPVSGPPSQSDPANLESARELVEKAIAEVRLISSNLRPSELDDLGLVAALRSLLQEFQKRSGIRVQFKGGAPRGHLPLPWETGMTLYRIAQEALHNVEKHSRATQVDLAFNHSSRQCALTIRDNGRGFRHRSTASGEPGWGLKNIRERTALLGGRMELDSRLKYGTRVAVRFPLPYRKEGGSQKR